MCGSFEVAGHGGEDFGLRFVKVRLSAHYLAFRKVKRTAEEDAYAIIYDFLAPRIVVDVDCHAAQGRDFGGEFIEAGVVLAKENIKYVA